MSANCGTHGTSSVAEKPDHDLPCQVCGTPIGDHTIRGYAEELSASGIEYHMPMQEIPGGPLRFEGIDGEFAGSLDVAAAFVETALGRLPLLQFRFYGPERAPFPLINLVGDVRM